MYYSPFEDIWEPIVGFPGYSVSMSGMVSSHNGRTFKILKPYQTRYGHLIVDLRRDGIKYHKYVHRLVAEAFIPNPYRLPLVRHLNGDPTDNDIDNLAWGTQTDNMRDAIDNGSFKFFSAADRERAMRKRRTPVKAINLDTGAEIVFESQQEAARKLNVNQSDISNVLNKKRNRSHRWTFAYMKGDDYDENY